MKRLVTDDPQDNVEVMMNLAFVKDKEVWIRGGSETGEDCTMVEFQERMCRQCKQCKDVKLDIENLDAIGDYYMDCSIDGCPIGTAYFIAIQAAELREKLRICEGKQEQMEPLVTSKQVHCGNENCRKIIEREAWKYCPHCGQAVKWK